MNYEANEVFWPIGSLVLHDCDAKRDDMLMRVVRYWPNGRVEVEYVDSARKKRQLIRFFEACRNRRGDVFWPQMKELHDPARFGVLVKEPA